VQSAPAPKSAPDQEAEASQITDPEGPRPGETPEAEQAAMTAAFDAQPFDEPWRSVTEGKFKQAFVKYPGEASLVEVECRQTLCKLTVTRQRGRGRDNLKTIVARSVSEEDGFTSSSSFAHYGNRGDPVEIVYVSRNHHTLPDKNGKVTVLPKRDQQGRIVVP
jgi:hypothetical protein